jgi:hypothetical protein
LRKERGRKGVGEANYNFHRDRQTDKKTDNQTVIGSKGANNIGERERKERRKEKQNLICQIV